MKLLGLGSNLGDRKSNLLDCCKKLESNGVAVLRTSTIVESIPLVPKGAPEEWNIPYLNAVIEIQTDKSPLDLLIACKEVERAMGRSASDHWAPRVIDLDILIYDSQEIHEDGLRIPHPEIKNRSFVLDPLSQLAPSLVPPGWNGSVLETRRRAKRLRPQIMGILNITPDSFSDGGKFTDFNSLNIEVKKWTDLGVDIIDVGAESTRPGATALTFEEEWARLSPVLEALSDIKGKRFGPLLSVDTYHFATAQRCVDLGVDIINDVSGLSDPRFYDLALASNANFVSMHSLGLPASKTKTIPQNVDPVLVVREWAETQVENWLMKGLSLDRLVLDPGVGFGKTPSQSLKLLREIDRLFELGVRVLVGHSRKSFMNLFTDIPFSERDLETLGASAKLASLGVDILRVHNVEAHIRSLRSFSLVE